MSEKNVKIFPLKLDNDFSKEIDEIVFKISQKKGRVSKHKFCLDAIKEKVDNIKSEGVN